MTKLINTVNFICPLLPDGEGNVSRAGVRKRENSTSQLSDYNPGDTEKFLKFAGK